MSPIWRYPAEAGWTPLLWRVIFEAFPVLTGSETTGKLFSQSRLTFVGMMEMFLSGWLVNFFNYASFRRC